MESNELVTSMVALGGVPLILGLVQLFKPFIKDTRIYPLVAVGFGLAINLIAGWTLGVTTSSDWMTSLFNGVVAGLAASGLYSTGSTIKEGAIANKSNRPDEGENHEAD